MAWVRFCKDFNFSPKVFGGRVTTAYQAGSVMNVTTECARSAKASGAAVAAKSPRANASEKAGSDEDRA